MNAHAYQAPGLAPQELYFHYDALGNTTLLTDANANPKASFQYDLHTGRLINSWNPNNLEVINLEDGIVGSINITATSSIGKDIILPPRQPPNLGGSTNGDNWGTAQVYVGGNASGVQVDLTHPDFGKDCGDDGMEMYGNQRVTNCNFKTCNKLFSNNVNNTRSTKLRHDFAPTEYNCTLMNCCKQIYERDILGSTRKGETTIFPSDGSSNPKKTIPEAVAKSRYASMTDWMKEHSDDCKKFFK